MELNFLGRGSGFNPTEGSTSAYFIEDGNLFLIDCGESVYRRIVELNLLDNIHTVYFFCTHTHSDHIGSLGSLVLHCYHKAGIPFVLVCPSYAEHLCAIRNILDAFDCKDKYVVIEPDSLICIFLSFRIVRYMSTKHSETQPAYSLAFHTADGIVYYTGDTKRVDSIKSMITKKVKISALYVDTDTSSGPDSVHMNIYELADVVPMELRSRCYCMHLASKEVENIAISLGFNVVETV